MTSQSETDDVTMTRQVTPEKLYLTHEISILFTAIFTAGGVRKIISLNVLNEFNYRHIKCLFKSLLMVISNENKQYDIIDMLMAIL